MHLNWLRKAQELRPDAEYLKPELTQGIAIEKEHAPTIAWLKEYYTKNKVWPSDEEVFKNISKDHLDEFKQYYTELKNMESSLEKSAADSRAVSEEEVLNKESEILKKLNISSKDFLEFITSDPVHHGAELRNKVKYNLANMLPEEDLIDEVDALIKSSGVQQAFNQWLSRKSAVQDTATEILMHARDNDALVKQADANKDVVEPLFNPLPLEGLVQQQKPVEEPPYDAGAVTDEAEIPAWMHTKIEKALDVGDYDIFITAVILPGDVEVPMFGGSDPLKDKNKKTVNVDPLVSFDVLSEGILIAKGNLNLTEEPYKVDLTFAAPALSEQTLTTFLQLVRDYTAHGLRTDPTIPTQPYINQVYIAYKDVLRKLAADTKLSPKILSIVLSYVYGYGPAEIYKAVVEDPTLSFEVAYPKLLEVAHAYAADPERSQNIKAHLNVLLTTRSQQQILHKGSIYAVTTKLF